MLLQLHLGTYLAFDKEKSQSRHSVFSMRSNIFPLDLVPSTILSLLHKVSIILTTGIFLYCLYTDSGLKHHHFVTQASNSEKLRFLILILLLVVRIHAKSL